MDDAQRLDAVRRGKLPYTNAANGGSLGLLCNELRTDEALELVITRSRAGWDVVITMPDNTTRSGIANTVHNALWEAMR